MDKKRIIFAILFLIICIILGYAMYRVFFAPKTPAIPPTGKESITGGQFPNIGEGGTPVGTPPAGQLPSSQEKPSTSNVPTITTGAGANINALKTEAVTRVVDVQAKSVTVGKDGGAKFYNAQDGKFYRLLADGTIVPMSDQTFYNVDDVTWSPSKNESIIEYPDGSNVLYDFDTKKQITLPRHWEDFAFSPQGDKIVTKSIGIDATNRWLLTSNPNGSSISVIESLGDYSDKVIVDWSPNNKVVALSRTGSPAGGDAQEVYLIGTNKENFKSLVVEGRGLEAKWSPGGQKLLHSVYSERSEYKPELWIVSGEPDTVGSGRKPLGVNTWASKCTMADERFAYCGVPTTLDTGVGFAPTLADGTSDKLYKIDTATGFKTEIPLNGNYTINTINISGNKNTLYFTDKSLDGVFQVKI